MLAGLSFAFAIASAACVGYGWRIDLAVPPLDDDAVLTEVNDAAVETPQVRLTEKQFTYVWGKPLRKAIHDAPQVVVATPVVKAAPVAPPIPPPNVKAVGVFLEKDRQRALLQTTAGELKLCGPGDIIELSQGLTIQVETIAADRVTVLYRERTFELKLPDRAAFLEVTAP